MEFWKISYTTHRFCFLPLSLEGMRKWMAAALLLLIVFTQVGYYGFFAIEQQIIRYEQKKKILASLNDEELKRIPLQPGMEFMDDDQEFMLEGEKYDIVRVKNEEGRKVFYAVNDKDETRLLKKLAQAGRSQGQGAKKGILKLSTVYCQYMDAKTIQVNIDIIPQNPVSPSMHGRSFHRDMAHPPDQA